MKGIKKESQVVSIRLPKAFVEKIKKEAEKNNTSVNAHLSDILARLYLENHLTFLSTQEKEFIDKIYFWEFMIENLGTENVQNMIVLMDKLNLKK